MKPIVFYHYPCLDGFTAAWAVWTKHPDWEFIPAKHGETLPDVTGRDVYFVDFSVKRPQMLEIIEKATKVTILDHHKTAEADLSGLSENFPDKVYVHFDMEKSGARLAWEYFHDTVPPSIIKYVEDRDLWRFQYGATRAINAYLFSFDYTFGEWDVLDIIVDRNQDTVIEAGEAILRKQEKDIKELAANVFTLKIGGYTVPCVNVPYTYASEMGNYLCKGKPFAASFFYNKSQDRVYSLRSDESGIDVSEIAKKYGGGGHKHAAGFTISEVARLLQDAVEKTEKIHKESSTARELTQVSVGGPLC